MLRSSVTVGVAAAVLGLALAACAPRRPAGTAVAPPIGGVSTDPAGWQHVTAGSPRQVVCGELPVLVEASRTKIRLTGSCGYVRVAGDHDDVTVDLAPGGTIEITGEHNDVSWKQPNAAVRPSLYNRGQSNSFHPRAPA